MAEAVKSFPVGRAASQDLVLSHACPYIHSHSFPKGSHQLLRASQYDSVGTAFLASFFFLIIWLIPRISWELVTKYVYFFPGAHHPRATTLGKISFYLSFSLVCFYTSSVSC